MGTRRFSCFFDGGLGSNNVQNNTDYYLPMSLLTCNTPPNCSIFCMTLSRCDRSFTSMTKLRTAFFSSVVDISAWLIFASEDVIEDDTLARSPGRSIVKTEMRTGYEEVPATSQSTVMRRSLSKSSSATLGQVRA